MISDEPLRWFSADKLYCRLIKVAGCSTAPGNKFLMIFLFRLLTLVTRKSQVVWRGIFCFDQGLEWHPRKKSIANEPGAFCRSEASGSLHIHDKSKIPATSTMLQAKNSAGSASTRAGERVKSSGTGSFWFMWSTLTFLHAAPERPFLLNFWKKSSAFTQDRQCVL